MKILKVNEAGISMVEMLGVLAIIGVLSVAGIAGYSIAMRSYRTNEIVNAMAKLYVLGQAQNQGNGDQELPYTTIDTKLPSGVSALKYNADKSISITITDENDYAMVKNKLGDKASEDTSGSNYSLKVGFEETTMPPVGNASDYDNETECTQNGYYWLNVVNMCWGNETRPDVSYCYSSETEAVNDCPNRVDTDKYDVTTTISGQIINCECL